jgi:hypothetical protein
MSKLQEYEDASTKTAAAHKAELEAVDAKVRKLLQGRDETIASLNQKVRDAEKRQLAAERMLAQLNEDLAAVNAPSRRRG